MAELNETIHQTVRLRIMAALVALEPTYVLQIMGSCYCLAPSYILLNPTSGRSAVAKSHLTWSHPASRRSAACA